VSVGTTGGVPKRGPGRPPKNAVTPPSLDEVIENPDVETPKEPETVLVHFVEDGLTILGQVWYRGQEIEVTEGTDAWDLLVDPAVGMLLTLDEDQQIDRWGKRYFRPGAWRGNGYDTLEDLDHLSEEEKIRLRQIEKDRVRYRLPDQRQIQAIQRLTPDRS
jgi:hypothetical protein